MLEAIMTQPGNIEFKEVPKPIPAEDEVLIKVVRIGVILQLTLLQLQVIHRILLV